MQIVPGVLWLLLAVHTAANSVSWKDIDAGQYGSYPTQRFISSKLLAPYVNFVTRTSACNDGLHYFIAPRGWKNKIPGPMILDENGTLIWSQHFDNEFGGQAYDLRVQNYKGEDYLTFWLGDDRVRGHGAGHYYMLNSSYDIVHKIGAANGKFADLHEFTITPEGTALMIIFESIEADMRPLGRKFSDLWNQAAWDCLFQEIDLATSKVLFEWRASTHLNMTHSYKRIESPDIGTRDKPFDWIHMNGVDKDESGNYLVSIRDLHALVYVDGKTQNVIWTLGGRNNDFSDMSHGAVLNMAWQHDAKFISAGAFPKTYKKPARKTGVETRLITVFDNAALDWDYRYGTSYSRALLLELTYPKSARTTQHDKAKVSSIGDMLPSMSKLDTEKVNSINGINPAYSVRLVHEYINPQKTRSSTQGSVQVLEHRAGQDSHVFVGYGINSVMTDYHGNGTVACDVHFGAKTSWETGDIQSYRAYRGHWTGRPKEPPMLARTRNGAYVSWNGATEVRHWLLQATIDSDLDEGWEDIVLVPKTGFETEIPVKLSVYDVSARNIRVQAVDDKGQICTNGISHAVVPYRFAGGAIARLVPYKMSYIYIAFMALTVGSALLVLYQRVLRRREHTTSNKHLD